MTLKKVSAWEFTQTEGEGEIIPSEAEEEKKSQSPEREGMMRGETPSLPS